MDLPLYLVTSVGPQNFATFLLAAQGGESCHRHDSSTPELEKSVAGRARVGASVEQAGRRRRSAAIPRLRHVTVSEEYEL